MSIGQHPLVTWCLGGQAALYERPCQEHVKCCERQAEAFSESLGLPADVNYRAWAFTLKGTSSLEHRRGRLCLLAATALPTLEVRRAEALHKMIEQPILLQM
jgi:hypothetical protein